MKTTAAASFLALAAAVLAAPTSLPTSLARRAVGDALNDCSGAPDPNQCRNVVVTIARWDNSVNEVNDFLNRAAGLAGADLQNAAQFALSAANFEPGFLGTLQGTGGLSGRGQDAATTLGSIFPTVPGALQQAANGEISGQSAINAINQVRCGTGILENIAILWIEAAAAVGADVPGGPLGPFACEKEPENIGDAYN